MYSFEGQYKRRPVQDLSGASRKEQRNVLLQRTQDDRQRRQDQRKKIQSATLIQSVYRGYRVRQELRNQARQEFDHVLQTVEKQRLEVTPALLNSLLRPLVFCYRPKSDAPRLTAACQILLKNRSVVASYVCSSDNRALYQVTNVLHFCISHLKDIAKGSSPLALPMRMLEVFCDSATYKDTVPSPNQSKAVVRQVLKYLLDRGYYQCMRALIDEKIPASLEYTVSAPTPVAGSIFDLVRIPLSLVKEGSDNTFRASCLSTLCTELFCSAYSEQISQYVLPAFAYSKDPFPLVELLHVLVPVCQTMSQASDAPHTKVEALPVQPSPWLLCFILTLSKDRIDKFSKDDLQRFLLLLHQLVPYLQAPKEKRRYEEEEDSDDEESPMDMDGKEGLYLNVGQVRQVCIRLLDGPHLVRGIVSAVSRGADNAMLTAVCTVCHTLMTQNKLPIPRTRLFYSLAFNPHFIRSLWYACCSVSTTTVTGSQLTLLKMLSRGMQMQKKDLDRIVPLLSVFCSLFSNSLITLHDAEFYGDISSTDVTPSSMPFKVDDLVPMSLALRDACVGIIELAHPDTKPTLKEDYRKAFQSVGATQNLLSIDELQQQMDTWAYLFKVIVQLVRQLHSRDTRRRFCPPGHWLTNQVHIHADRLSQLFKADSGVFERRPFGALSALNTRRYHGNVMEEDVPHLSTNEVRNLTVLMEMPFIVPFEERVKIFQRLIRQDKAEHQGDMRHFMGGPHISIMVRRNYLYEDAFEKLSPENEPNLKLKTQVQLVNFAGLDEAGIDGGGILREFIAELIKDAFHPNRGLFKNTLERTLYPNPGSKLVMDSFTDHYFFCGRILGKAMYESMLVELPFAGFFLSKLLSRSHGNVDIHHLQSLDPEMYRHLLSLKYDESVNEMDLDFTVVENEFGEAKVVELKPGGRNIPVDGSNRIEYIHLMADYRLNKQIHAQVQAFRRGLADVINLEWLRMFDHRELQILISGAYVPVDINDLKQHTNYSGGYDVDHPVIKALWSAVEKFTEEQKRKLLRFVTSCSRPPLLGFRELHPAFCVHYGGKELDRLPTASTCMNLLKLPEFKDEETLKAKLLYAIESDSGFELS